MKMKRACIVMVLAFIYYYQLEAKEIAGYYISRSLDTVNVTFSVPVIFFSAKPNYKKLQRKVKYYDSLHQHQVLFPSDVNEISFEYKGKKIRMLSRLGNLGNYDGDMYMFLNLIKDGKLKLFEYYEKTYYTGIYNGATGVMTVGGSYTTQKYIMQKDNGYLFRTRWLSFRKDMMDYLSDCPSLAKKIDDRMYGNDDVEKIIDEYNSVCK